MNLKYHMLFALILVSAVALRIIYYMGPSGADDMIYFSVVEKLLSNQDAGTAISSSTHWGVRLGMVLPVWAAMKVFGISEFSSYLFPMLSSAGIMVFIYIAALRLFNHQVALLSSLTFALLPQDVYLSTVMYPDGPVVLFSALFIYLFYKLSGNKETDAVQAIIAGIILGLAYYIRETALILLITVPILLFHAPNKKNFIKTAFFILTGLLIAIAFEMLVFWLLTGGPLTRWEILLGKTKVLELREFTVYSHSNVRTESLFSQYLFDPFFVIFATHWISPLMNIVVAGVVILQMTRKGHYRFFSLKKGHFLWLFILTFAILAFYSFGPIYGFSVPLKREVRYYHSIIPLASLLSGVIVYEFMVQKGVKRLIGYSMVLFYVLASS
ncbi:MAG: glycosyltransferase family 39 protein, partial [Nitrospirae bacterium]|nr:glycosyltransferase family 39 protein [Nitrospirota bacterium]